jgi:CHAT domain-containing protein/tetratricopeptide (TPR) repeat protein
MIKITAICSGRKSIHFAFKIFSLLICYFSYFYLAIALAQNNEVNIILNPKYVEGLKLLGKGDYHLALSNFKQVVEEQPKFLRAYKKIVDTSLLLDMLGDSEVYFKSILSSDQFRGGAFFGLGIIETKHGDYKKAINLFKKSIEFEESECEAYVELFKAYLKIKQIPELENYIKISKKNDKNPNYDLLLGFVHMISNNANEGRAVLNEVLKTKRKLRYIADCAESYFSSNTNKSLELGLEGIEVSKKQNDLEWEGWFLRIVGVSYWIQNNYEKAEEFFKKGLKIAETIADKTIKEFNSAGLGITYDNQANYQKALQYYYLTLRLSQENNNLGREPAWLSNIANVYQKLGDYDLAIDFLQDAIQKSYDKTLNLYLLGCIASVYKDKKDFSNALDYYSRAISIEDPRMQSEWLIDMGVIYQTLGQYEQAILSFKEAIKVNKSYGSLRNEANALNKIGHLYNELNQISESNNYLKQALKIGESIVEPPIIWDSFLGMAKNLEKNDQMEDAIHYYDLAIEQVQLVRSQLFSDAHKTDFFAQYMDVYERCIDLLIKKDKKFPNAGFKKKAFNYAQGRTARALLDIVSLDKKYASKRIDKDVLEKKQNIEKRLQSIQSAISKEVTEKDQNQDVLDSLYIELEQSRKQHKEMIQEINRDYPIYSSLIGEAIPLTVEETQEKITKNNTLLQYIVGKEKSFLFAVNKDSMIVVTIDVKKEILEQKIRELIQPLHGVTNLSDIKYDLGKAHELYKILIAPVEEFLVDGNQHLQIIPDGILFYLPFEALVVNIGDQEEKDDLWYSSYRVANYLINRYKISYSQSANMLDPKLRSNVKDEEIVGELIAFGDPNYFGIEEEELQMRSNFGWNFHPLRFSKDEVKSIGKLFKPSKVFINEEANEENVKINAENYKILHFSAHGLMDEKQSLYSGIALTQDDDETEDGFLQAYEVYNMDLNAELVTLSACKTGLGTLKNGEGILGLTRAFIYAGARSVLVSLWNVADHSTTNLMKNFYDKWRNNGLSHVAALQQAKLQIMKETTEIGGQEVSYAHPFFWAPFIIVGETDLHFKIKRQYNLIYFIIGFGVIMIISFSLTRLKRIYW